MRERFDGLAGSLELERRTLVWEAESPQALAQRISENTPPQVAARAALPAERYEAMQAELLELIRRWAGGDGPVAIDAEYLLIVARRRG